MNIKPQGRRGFASKQDALDDAGSTVVGDEVIVLRFGKEFGWVWPVEYGEQLVLENISVARA